MKHLPRKRAAFSLIELLFVMAISTGVLAVLAGLMSRTIHSHSVSTENVSGMLALAPLAEQFRRDVHAADRATIDNDAPAGGQLSLEFVDGTRIEYIAAPLGLRRARNVGGAVSEREEFVLTGMKILGWSQSAEDGTISLRLAQLAPGAVDETVTNTFEITVRLARDPRWSKAP